VTPTVVTRVDSSGFGEPRVYVTLRGARRELEVVAFNTPFVGVNMWDVEVGQTLLVENIETSPIRGVLAPLCRHLSVWREEGKS
jgi:CTP-dependent riboflavin kinase